MLKKKPFKGKEMNSVWMPHDSSVRHAKIMLGFIVDWRHPRTSSIILPEKAVLG